MATAIPSRVLVQAQPASGQNTLLIRLDSNIKLATLCLKALNTDGAASGEFSFWIVPKGQATPQTVNLEQSGLRLEPKASSVDFGLSLEGGDAIYVQSTLAGIKFTVNGISHLN